MGISFAVLVVLQIFLANCEDSNDNVYRDLPPIFHIDDYEDCKAEGNFYCKASVVLRPSGDNRSYHWKLIEKSINDSRAYNHNELFHAICVKKFCQSQFSENRNLQEVISDCYKKKYENLGLTGDIINLTCSNRDIVYEAGIFDVFWLSAMLLYVFFLLYATFWHYRRTIHSNGNESDTSKFGGKYFMAFSIISNWKKFKTIKTSPDFQKLKCMQGIRFYNMLLIIFCHTYSSFIGGYVENTDYIENIPKSAVRLIFRNLLVFLVQTFFLFSAFLLSYHFFQMMERSKKFDLRIIILTFVNRYLRIIPPVLFMVGTGSTIWLVSFYHGPITDLYADLELRRCQKNWWTSLLFINNHYNQYDMCFFTTWYLAADTQLYVLSLLLLSLIWVFKKKVQTFLASSVLIGILIPSAITYVYDLDIIYRITPENSKYNKFRSFNFNAIYSSSYANMATYMVGLCYGYLYFKHSHTKMFKNLISRLTWAIVFIGLPLAVIVVSSHYHSRLLNSILSGILKPLYATGIAMGILGMAQNIGGFAKRVCEWRPALVMGNITYSTYVTHYGIVFYRTATAKHPLYISDIALVTSFAFDAIISFFCGFLVHILLEMPASQLQSMFVPQIRRQRSQKEKAK